MNRTIRMYTTDFCGDCRRAKWFLKTHQIAYEEIRIEHTPGAAEFVIRANQGKRRVPTFEIDGRTFHCSPFDPDKLTHELGL
jgi:mycoredoxin